MTKRLFTRLGLPLALALLALAAPAAASAAQAWRIDALSDTAVAPGETTEILVQTTNVGDADMDGSTITLHGTLGAGLTVAGAKLILNEKQTEEDFTEECTAADGSSIVGATTVKCENTTPVPSAANLGLISRQLLRLTVTADSGAGGELTSSFSVEGGGAASAETVDSIQATPAPPAFGIDAFDEALLDAAGNPFTQAGGHPAAALNVFDLNTYTNPAPVYGAPLGGAVWPVEAVKDVTAELPPGVVGNPTVAEQCTLAQLGASTSKTLCPPASQVGTVLVHMNNLPLSPIVYGPMPVYNVVPPLGAPARFGFNVAGTVVVLDAEVRSSGDYGLSIASHNLSEAVPIAGSQFTFWGVPTDPSHGAEHACPGTNVNVPSSGGPSCAPPATHLPFLRTSTACTAPGAGLEGRLQADSWAHPGARDANGEPDPADPNWHSMSSIGHAAPGYPYPPSQRGAPVGIDGCGKVPFHPGFSVQATSGKADSPSGLDLHITVPQECWDHPEEICSSDLRDAEVKLPQGMTLNPSAASGLSACTSAQAGLITPAGQSSPIHFDEAPVSCPDSSKIGEVTIATPLLSEPLSGSVYLAKQQDNPFGSLLAMYLVAEGSGVVIKQAGEIELGPGGRLITRFAEAPQQPFSDLHVELFGGERATLRTPPSCGTFAVGAKLTPWSGGAPADVSGAFEIESCPGSGFDPKLSAGTQNPLAGATSPFSLRITRNDGEQELGGLTAILPPGLSGYLKGIPYCPDSALAAVSGELGTGVGQEQQPSCPAASQVGTVTVGAGAGSNPFYTSAGRAYLAGPYKGAPLSLAVVAPAVAGPLDLGSVVVRNAIHVDPESAQLTVVSDPLPTALHGVPLDLRDVRVNVNRDRFTLNPTSCEPMSVGSSIASAQGATASPSVHFQAAGCERLGFKPKLGLKLFGKPNRGANPRLRAVLSFPKGGGANLASARVALPHSEFLDQAHIRTICTRVQFAADACPAGSIYGYARATSPIVDYPVQGPVYLRSSSHELPDLVLALSGPAGQPVEVDAVGRIDSIHGGIRTTFESTPDVPIEKVVLTMKGGAKGLIQNSRDICAHTYRATADLTAHNARSLSLRPAVQSNKCGGPHRASSRGRHPVR